MAHAGSWFGLPDYGITEAIGSLFGSSRTAQGGSNVLGAQAAPASTYKPAAVSTGQQYGPYLPTNTGGGSYSQPQQYSAPQQQQSNGGQSSGPSQQDQYRQQQESAINSQFGEYFSNLDRQLGALPDEQALQSGKIENMATSQMGDITLGNQQTQQTIDTGITNAQSNKATSLRDLEADMRSSLFAGNQYLGARGAGDSSASNMYSFALSKQANKAKSGVLDTFNKTLAGLDQKKVELQNITNQEMTKLKTWKDNALLDVTNYINQKKDQLQSLISQGRIDQATAMRELNTNIYNQAQQRLAAIDQQASAFSQSMSAWATQRAASLDDYKLQLTQQANFSIPDVIQSEMMAYAPQAQTGGYSGTPLYGSYGGVKKDQWGNPIG